MTEYDWHQIYHTAVETFGGRPPGAQLEAMLLETFQHSPQTVVQVIDKASAAYQAGTITSPWGIVQVELNRIANQPALTATDSSSRDKQIERAENYVRFTLAHLDREDELLDELFGEGGMLRTYAQVDLENIAEDGQPAHWAQSDIKGDRLLAERMLNTWRTARPVAEAIEDDAIARAEKFKTQQAELQAALAKLRPSDKPFRKPLPEADYSADPTEDLVTP